MRSSPTGEPAFEGRKPELALGFDGPGASMGYGRILAAAHAAIEHEVAGSGGQTGIGLAFETADPSHAPPFPFGIFGWVSLLREGIVHVNALAYRRERYTWYWY